MTSKKNIKEIRKILEEEYMIIIKSWGKMNHSGLKFIIDLVYVRANINHDIKE